MYTVYGMMHPVTNKLVYVGCTKNLRQRMNNWRSTKKIGNKAVAEWMANLRSKGLRPAFVVLSQHRSPLQASRAESLFWWALTNHGRILNRGTAAYSFVYFNKDNGPRKIYR